MPARLYRITVEELAMLDAQQQSAGEEGLQSLTFFASHDSDILATASALRERLDCSALNAAKLAIGLSLINQVIDEPSAVSANALHGDQIVSTRPRGHDGRPG